MKKKLILFFVLMSFYCLIFADVFIQNGTQVFIENNAIIHTNGNFSNAGSVTSDNGGIRFFGSTPSTYFSSTLDVYKIFILDKSANHSLLLDHAVRISGRLYLVDGILNSSRNKSDMSRKDNLSSYRSNEEPSKPIMERTGNLILNNGSSIYRSNGIMGFSPVFANEVSVHYLNSLQTGNELPDNPLSLQDMVVENSGVSILLSKDVQINSILTLNTNLLETNENTLTMGSKAIIDATPDQIIGNLVAEPEYVGTGSYTNLTHGVHITAGNDIGSLRSLVFIRPCSIGVDQSISKRWRLESDYSPQNRDIDFYWYASKDNGNDLSQLQVWKYNDTNQQWFAQNEITSTTTNPRSITVEDITSFSDWTVADAVFQVSCTEIDFGNVAVSSSATQQITITNLKDHLIKGYIDADGVFSVAEARSERKKSGRDKARSLQRRSSLYFEIDANGTSDFNISFSPTENISYNDNISIRLDATNPRCQAVNVIGTGYNPPQLTFDPQTLYQELPGNSSAQQQITLTNDGDVQLDYTAEMLFEESVLLQENFESGIIPTTWMMTTNSAIGWFVSNNGGSAWFDIPEHSFYACSNDDAAGQENDGSLDYLITPAMDFSIYDSVSLNFASFYTGDFSQTAHVEINSGSGWVNVHNLIAAPSSWNEENIDLSSYCGVGNENVQIAFHSNDNGAWGSGWAIDDIEVVGHNTISKSVWANVNGYSSIEGNIAATSNENITINFDSSNLFDDMYQAILQITSNDPINPIQEIPITMCVASPILDATPNLIEFGEILVGSNSSQQFTIQNSGNSLLQGTIGHNDVFTIQEISKSDQYEKGPLQNSKQRSTLNFSINEGESKSYEVIFSPTEEMEYTDTITITSNGGNDSIGLSGTGIMVDIATNPTSFSTTLEQETQGTDELTISTTGSGTLQYQATVSYPTKDRFQATVYPNASSKWTGSCNETDFTEISLVKGYNDNDGWMCFDISSIPDNAIIYNVVLHAYVNETSYPYWSVTPLSNNPLSIDATTLHNDIVAEEQTNYYLFQNETSTFSPGWKQYELEGNVASDFQTSLIQDWFGIGIASRDNSTTYYINFDGWNEDNPPYLSVHYSQPAEDWLHLNDGLWTGGSIVSSTPENVTVTMDATDLLPNLYTAYIDISSNDPDESMISIPVSLEVIAPLVAPTNVTVTIVGTQLTLTWDDTGASYYRIYVAESPNGMFTDVTGNGTFTTTKSQVSWFTSILQTEIHKFYQVKSSNERAYNPTKR